MNLKTERIFFKKRSSSNEFNKLEQRKEKDSEKEYEKNSRGMTSQYQYQEVQTLMNLIPHLKLKGIRSLNDVYNTSKEITKSDCILGGTLFRKPTKKSKELELSIHALQLCNG